MMLLCAFCFCSVGGALRHGASPALGAPSAEEQVRARLLEAQRKFAEASAADIATPVSFVAGASKGGSGIPVVDVSLSQGASAWPGIAAAIAEADSSHEVVEAQLADADAKSFNVALKAAEGPIDDAARRIVESLAGSAASFVDLGLGAGPQAVDVSVGEKPEIIDVTVPAAAPLDEEVIGRALRSADRREEMLRELPSDFQGLTEFVLHQLHLAPTAMEAEKRLAAVGNASLNLHSAASAVGDAFPTATSLIKSAAHRRSVGENLARRKHLALQMSFLKRLNRMIAGALRRNAAASAAVSFFDEKESSQKAALKSSMQRLVSEVDAGGRTARVALQELAALSGTPDARAAMVSAGAVRGAETLLKRPSTDEVTRAAAGSLLTLLTDMPVTAAIANERTGSGGHIEIVVPRPSRVYAPDAVIADMMAGVRPSRARDEQP